MGGARIDESQARDCGHPHQGRLLQCRLPDERSRFSTNNTHFGHPNEEAVARVVVNDSQPTLWFDYDTPKNRRWQDPRLQDRHGYQVRYPDTQARMTLDLFPAAAGARAKAAIDVG